MSKQPSKARPSFYKSKFMNSSALTRGFVKEPAAIVLLGAAVVLSCLMPSRADAFNIYNGEAAGNNLEINLTTTLSYTPIFRIGDVSSILTSPTGNANGSEGDLDFQHGLVSNLFEVLPILDIKDGNYGAHFSGEGYVNTSFLGQNQNDQPSTINPFSIARSTDFTSATKNVDGRNIRLLDAFGYGTQYFGANDQQSVTLKVGRQTLLWGQSLFLANNGIAAGQAPIDIITANNNPNAEAQQIFEPVGQAVLTYQVNPIVTLQGYYQFEWQHDYFQGVGAYFNSADVLDKGGQRVILGPGAYAFRIKDGDPPHQNGQFGASVQLTLNNYDLGFYGLRYDAKAPTGYLRLGLPTVTPNGVSLGTYQFVYPRDIWIEGTALSTTVGPANVAGEVSFREHMPLVTGFNFPTAATNINNSPAYPVGDTWAAQVSSIYASPGIPFDPGGVTFTGEVGMNHVYRVTQNSAAITDTPHRSSTAAQFQVVLTPNYYNVLPQLQLGFPIGFFYNFYGRSRIDSTENHGTGNVNFGVTATYKQTWIASVTYQDYIGKPNPNLQGEPSVADRSFVLLNFQHSF